MSLLVPKKYNPPGKHTPMEYPALLTRKEMGLLKMHGGAGKKTKWGVPSFYMEGGTGTRGTSGIGTSSKGTSSPGKTSSSGGGGYQGGPNAGGNAGGAQTGGGGKGGVGGGGNTNQGNTGTGGVNNPGRGGSGIGGGLGIGRDPAMGGNYGRGTVGMQQGGFNNQANQVARSVASAVNRAGPQYTGPARYNQPFNANRSQQTFGSYPNSMSGMMPGATGFASPAVNPMAPQAQADPSTFPARPSVIAQNNVSVPSYVSAMKQARMSTFPARPGFAAPNTFNKPEPSQFASNLGYQGDLEARAKAVSRGPGSVAGVMPGASPLAQQRSLHTIANSMNEDPRFSGMRFNAEGLQGLSQTIPGEALNQGPMGQTAVANTMVNRMALAAKNPEKYGYMGGEDIDSLMGQYDATGMRPGTTPNSAFTGATLGTDALGSGIASLAGALASNSQFNTTMPPSVKDATHFLTRNAQLNQQKYPQGPRNWSNNPNQPFSPVGDHLFGNAENTAAQVAALRNGPTPTGPTQTAGLSPAAAPPSPQVPQGESWFGNLQNKVGTAAKSAYAQYTDANQKINKMGGGARVAALGKMAQAIMDHLPGGSGGRPSGRGSFGKGGNRDNNERNNNPRGQPGAPTVAPPVAPPAVNQVPWFYPQYQSQWAGLPTGIGGYARG